MSDPTRRDDARPDDGSNGLPKPVGDCEVVSKASLHGIRAVAEFNATVGYDIREVMRDEWWKVGIVDGEPVVLLAREGMRAMAPFAPRPDAAEFIEEVIAAVDGHWGQR